MTSGLFAAAAIAVSAVAAGLYVIHRWGPGITRRSVRCPEKNVRARIEVSRKEGSFGALLEPDVSSCSLFPEGSPDCDKKCLGSV